MGIGSPNPLLLAAAASGGGETEESPPPPAEDPVIRSLRFDGSAYLSRSTGSTSTTWTLSFWVKRSTISGPSQHQYLATWGISGSAGEGLVFRGTGDSSNTDKLMLWNGSTSTYSSAVYRDPSAWANICISVNSGTATVYYNGESIISGISGVQAWGSMRLGAWLNQNELEGMMADVYGVEGSALDHTSFTESNDYGGLKPKAYTGSFGTNGFHIDAQVAHGSDLMVSSVARNDGDTDFADAAQGHGLTVSGDTKHSVAVGNPFTGDDRAMYFDASGDYVTVDDSDDLTLSTDDWTIEGWFKWDGATSQQWTLAQKSWAGSSYGTGSDWHILYYSGYLRFYGSYYAYDGNNRYFHRSFTPTLGKWHHVAVVQNSGSTQLYVDGKELGTAQNTSGWSWNNSTGDLTLNRWQGSANSTYSRPDRAVYDFRIVKGTAVYTGEFTPPSGKLTATGGEYPSTTNVNTSITSSHTVLHLQPVKTDSSLHDETSNHTVSKTSGTSYDKASTPYEAAAKSTAMHFDGNGDEIVAWVDGTSGDYDFGTADYTIECWAYIDSSDSAVGTYNVLCASALYKNQLYEYGGNVRYYSGSSGGTNSATGVTFPTSQWNHVAVVRDSGTMRIYINGKFGFSYSQSGDAGGGLTIGGGITGYPAYSMDGHIYDFRVTGGEAKYSGTSTASDWANFDEITAPFELNPVYLGGDQSGNKNHFTPTNISQTHDVMLDTPTRNYATMSPVNLAKYTGTITFGEGNLSISSSNAANKIASTIAMPNGKWYAEIRPNARNNAMVGVCRPQDIVVSSQSAGYGGAGHVVYIYNGSVYNGSTTRTSYAFSQADGDDVIQLAVDVDNSKIWFGLNNTWEGTVGSSGGHSLDAGEQVFAYTYRDEVIWNFGQDPTFAGNKTSGQDTTQDEFYYAPPTGFSGL